MADTAAARSAAAGYCACFDPTPSTPANRVRGRRRTPSCRPFPAVRPPSASRRAPGLRSGGEVGLERLRGLVDRWRVVTRPLRRRSSSGACPRGAGTPRPDSSTSFRPAVSIAVALHVRERIAAPGRTDPSPSSLASASAAGDTLQFAFEARRVSGGGLGPGRREPTYPAAIMASRTSREPSHQLWTDLQILQPTRVCGLLCLRWGVPGSAAVPVRRHRAASPSARSARTDVAGARRPRVRHRYPYHRSAAGRL